MIVNSCIENVKSYVIIEKSCIEIMNEIIIVIEIWDKIKIKIKIFSQLLSSQSLIRVHIIWTEK